MTENIKLEKIQCIEMKPADNKETAKLLMTWAKKHKKLHLFKIVTYIVQELNIRGGKQITTLEIISNFYKYTKKENEFIRTLELWKKIIEENGTTWRQICIKKPFS